MTDAESNEKVEHSKDDDTVPAGWKLWGRLSSTCLVEILTSLDRQL